MALREQDDGSALGSLSHDVEADQAKVALWGVPRAASTVLMKCLSSVPDIDVYMELYSYAAVVINHFVNTTGTELPAELEGNEQLYEDAAKRFTDMMHGLGVEMNTHTLSYCNLKRDLENTTKRYVLIKEQAHLFEMFVSYLPRGFKHVFLIRDPSRVFASFRKAFAGAPELAVHLPLDFDIIRDDFLSLTPMLWFEKLHKMWKYVRENIDPNPLIIDAFDIVSRPESTLKALCEAVGLPFSEALLEWEAGVRFPDNVVTASPDVHTQRFLYGTALDSTHFAAPPPEAAGPIPRDQVTDDVIRCVEYSMPFYQEMYDQRLKV